MFLQDLSATHWNGRTENSSSRATPSPFGTVPPSDEREELPPWLVDGILPMEDIIKAYYERQGVGDLYEQQIPKK